MSQKCKVKMAERHFIILWRFGVVEENLGGGGGGGGEKESRSTDRAKCKISFYILLNQQLNHLVIIYNM